MDKKAWSPETIQKWFKASAKGNVVAEGSAKTGQLFRDIIAAEKGTKILWSFDARAGVIGRDKLLGMTEEAIEKNLDSIAGTLGYSIDSAEKRIEVLDEITDKVMANFDIEIGGI